MLCPHTAYVLSVTHYKGLTVSFYVGNSSQHLNSNLHSQCSFSDFCSSVSSKANDYLMAESAAHVFVLLLT